MTIELGVLLTLLLVVGFLAQWLAWRIRVPAILFLLLVGIVMGPVTGLFDPDRALGPLLFPAISLAVALILFEGSLTLRLHELRDVGKAVRGLVSYGALFALLLLAVAAHFVAGVPWEIALLFGALTCVTGPTVITPMLRTLRPTARIAKTLRWEGIVIDPLGALFAVVIFEAIITHQQGHSLWVFVLTIGVGGGIGVALALALGYVLRRQMVPEYLQTYGTLIVVLGGFTAANQVADEAGLIAVTVMGITLGNLRNVHIEHIMDFKEHLSTLLISLLFVVLAARLPWPLAPGLLEAGIFLFLIAQFVIRPASVWLATAGSRLTWRERSLIAFVSPRGIVAASVSSLFALRLAGAGMAGAETLVPLVFSIIIGTVVLQSATARPLARWLKVADPDPSGALIYGSDKVALAMAEALVQQQLRVMVVDDDWDGISQARAVGLDAFYGNPTSEHAAMHLDLTGLGHLLAMSTHRSLNSLACMQYRRLFGRERVYRLRILAPEESHDRAAFAGALQSQLLFGGELTHARFHKLLEAGWKIRALTLNGADDWAKLANQHGPDTVPLLALDSNHRLRMTVGPGTPDLKTGWTALALVAPSQTLSAAA